MQMDLEEIIRVRGDGTRDRVRRGAVIEIRGDNVNIAFLKLAPEDVVRSAVGILKAVHDMGQDVLMEQAFSYYFGNNSEWEDADAGRQAGTGSERRPDTDPGRKY